MPQWRMEFLARYHLRGGVEIEHQCTNYPGNSKGIELAKKISHPATPYPPTQPPPAPFPTTTLLKSSNCGQG